LPRFGALKSISVLGIPYFIPSLFAAFVVVGANVNGGA
jgi:hypothetical protein